LVQRYHDVTFRDLWDLADKIIQNSTDEADYNITTECVAIKSAVEQAVLLSKYTGGSSDPYSVANSHGISIYFPTTQTTTYDTDYDAIDFATYTGWGTFLKNKFN
jgi:hypothetical protein